MSPWLQLVEAASRPGDAVVAIAEVYVDESGTHAGSPLLGVGGYVFMRSKARRFSHDWARVLRREGVPYFHMTDLALGMGIYRDWTMERRISHEKELIALIKRTAAFGFAMCMSEAALLAKLSTVPRKQFKPYTFLLGYTLRAIERWMERTNFRGRPAFFFESGHAHSAEAHAHLMGATKIEGARYYGASHTFLDKREAPPLQAADLLVWLARNTMMKQFAGKPARRDYAALCIDRHEIAYLDDLALDRAMEVYASGAPFLGGNVRRDPIILMLPE